MKPQIRRKTETVGFLVTPRFDIEAETYLTKCPYFANLVFRSGDTEIEVDELKKEDLELIRDMLSHTIEKMLTLEGTNE